MCTGPRYRLIIYIRHLYISCNTPCSPPKTLRNICFSFLLGITAVPREVENNRARETKFHVCARRQTSIFYHVTKFAVYFLLLLLENK